MNATARDESTVWTSAAPPTRAIGFGWLAVRAAVARSCSVLEFRRLAVVPQHLQSILLDDAGGDALDAVLAALAALRAVIDPGFHNATHDLDYALEAHVYA